MSLMSKKLIDYGNASIVHLKNNDKVAAEAMLKSMVDAINQYHVTSLYAIQYDIYNYMLNMAKKHNFKSKFMQNTSEDIELELKIEPNLDYVSKDVLKSIDNVESYINSLIKHVKDFEKCLCSIRNKYLTRNAEQLIKIAKNKYYSACNSNDLKDIVKSIVKINYES